MKKTSILLLVVLCAVTPMFANPLLRLPEISAPIRIDGVIGADEWKDGAVLTPLLNPSGIPIAGVESRVCIAVDRQNLYIALTMAQESSTDFAETKLKTETVLRDGTVHKDDSVEVIVGAADAGRIYQIVANSRDTVMDSRISPVPDRSWTVAGLEVRSRVQGLNWNIEMKIPFQSLEGVSGREFLLNVCRNWIGKEYSSLGGGGYFDTGRMFRISVDKQAPAVKVNSFGHENSAVSFGLSSDKAASGSLESLTPENSRIDNAETELRDGISRILSVRTGKKAEWTMLRLEVRQGKQVVLRRDLKVADSGRVILPPPMARVELPGKGTFGARFYPGWNRVGFDCVFENNPLVAALEIRGHGPDGKNPEMRFPVKDGLSSGTMDLPTSGPGVWAFDIRMVGADGRTLAERADAFRFERRQWEWENKQLGVSREVIPPFTPLELNGNEVGALLRRHRLGGLGLWEQVNADGRDILADPVDLALFQEGKNVKWRKISDKITEKAPDTIVMVHEAEAEGVRLEVRSRYDYDGMVWYRLEFKAEKPVKVDSLSLKIPLRESETFLMHCLADLIRSNKTGAIPSGQGTVWDSRGIPRREVDGKPVIGDGFIPYVWLGGPSRGLCWFADSPANFNLDPSRPMVTVNRDHGVVTAEIALWSRPQVISGSRVLEFGMQATPVKPKPEFDRKLTGLTGGKIQGAQTLFFPVRPPGVRNDYDRQPRNGWELFRLFSRQLHTKDAPATELKRLENEWAEELKTTYAPYAEAIRRRFSRHIGKSSPVDYFVRRKISEFQRNLERTPNADLLIYYTDPRLEYMDTPEYRCFAAEWWAPQPVAYLRSARTFPAPSSVDYILWNIKKQLENGADGVYYDDTFVLPRANPEIGRPVPEMGILAMRDLIKRTAVLLRQTGKTPAMLMVHYTDALIIPAFSFANLGFTWEMRFNPADAQERFPEDYLLTESTGLQCGMTVFVINGLKHWPGIFGTDKWESFFKHKSKSIIAVTLQYGIKLWGNWDIREDIAFHTREAMFKFGVADDDCRFIPYWENRDGVKLNFGYKAATYLKGDSALLVISNFGNDSPAELRIDTEKLGISGSAVFTDLVSGKSAPANAAFTVSIPRNEYTLVHVGNPAEGARLLSTEGRHVIDWGTDEVFSGEKGRSLKRLLASDTAGWTMRPNFAKMPNRNASLEKTSDNDLIFKLDNRSGGSPADMVWTFDLPFTSTEKCGGIKIDYAGTNLLKNRRSIFAFIGQETGNKKREMVFQMNKDAIHSGEGDTILSRSIANGISGITRMFVRIQAPPGEVATIRLKDVILLD